MTAALRVTDGALVVVDCVESVCVQTETVLRQALTERIKPVVFMNKLDRLFLELHADVEDAYQGFVKSIESVNVVIATYNDELMGDVQVDPEKGTVGFGSGYQGWAFTLGQFARMYAVKFGIPEKRLTSLLWGDNYYNSVTKRWSKAPGPQCKERGFCMFIMKPIKALIDAIMANQKEKYQPMLTKLGITLKGEDLELTEKKLVKVVMQAWLPAATTLLGMIVNHLPSPIVAQRYRVENLYAGPMDDEVAHAIRHCNPEGPLMMYVSKMVPAANNQFFAFGRVFSGTMAQGQTVRIQGPEYIPNNPKGRNHDLSQMKLPRLVLMMGRNVEQISDVPCGNTVGVVGLDKHLVKSGTVTTCKDAFNIVDMKYSVSPVVRVSVAPVNAADLPKLIDGLKRLAKSDPLVQCIRSETGEIIIAGAGELHLEICIKDLREDFVQGCEIKLGRPVVPFCEAIREKSSMTVLAKSSNKHNRISMTAEPLHEDLVAAIDRKEFNVTAEVKERAAILTKSYLWDAGDARKIWSFGLSTAPTNVIVDCTKGISYMSEIRDSVVGAFQQASCEGPYCGEVLRGCRFNLVDVVLHADSIHRGMGQISPPTRAAMYAAIMKSDPVLLEPIYLVDISCPMAAVAGVYKVLAGNRGKVEGKEDRPGTPMCKIKGFLPVLASFGFTNLLVCLFHCAECVCVCTD